jgi:hypothetical protein
MPACFLMHRYHIRARFDEIHDVPVRVLDHKVHVEQQVRGTSQRFHYRRANRDIGHKMPVHDVHVDDGATAFGRAANLVRKVGEIS